MLSGLSIGHLLITLAVVLVVFGTHRLRSAGGDIGSAIKSFKDAVKDDKSEPPTPASDESHRTDPK